jgi:hypothetical protein
MVPFRICTHWVLLVIDFTQRATKLVCFKKETYDLPLEKLAEFATHIWRSASQVGVKTMGGSVFLEQQAANKWRLSRQVIAKTKVE